MWIFCPAQFPGITQYVSLWLALFLLSSCLNILHIQKIIKKNKTWYFYYWMDWTLMIYLYLKLWPVHVHVGAMVVAEPLEIFLWACWRDGAFKVSVYCDIAAKNQQRLSAWVTITSHCGSVAFFKRLQPLVLCEVEVAFDVQQHLSEEAQPLLLELLTLVEHLLHVFHVLRGALAQLIQSLLIFLLRLGCDTNTRNHHGKRNEVCNISLMLEWLMSSPRVPAFHFSGKKNEPC